MIIKLRNNNGKVIEEIEVDDSFGEWYIEQERIEENAKRKDRYWITVSLDSLDYEGSWLQDKSPTPAEKYELEEEKEKVAAFKKILTPTQLRRLELLEEGNTLREIARLEHTNLSAIQKTRDQIRKKYEDFFGDKGGQND